MRACGGRSIGVCLDVADIVPAEKVAACPVSPTELLGLRVPAAEVILCPVSETVTFVEIDVKAVVSET